MRVISGKLKGRVLKGYNIEGTRPTMDRVKESLFASIQDYVEDAVVLDLFAGSGNLGIEAISNGASICYFVDYNKECIKAINDNIKLFNIEDDCKVFHKDYKNALKAFKDNNIKFDIIFIDPPYKYNIKNELLTIIYNSNLLNKNGIIVFEYQTDEELENTNNYELLKNKKYGDKYISIYRKLSK
ncbi:MAG: 16S rRNA (guanine(966)-N(2))-methyltransferase RsmD [Bacilli bacterium]|nr:16S rRNA (guanine(966)-N(2))-methyltransferase RsmD [Bacilli bacterium]